MNPESPPALPLLRPDHLDDVPGLACAVTQRRGGVSPPPFDSLNLGLGTADPTTHAHTNRARVADALGFSSLTTPYQVHGNDVVVVDDTTDERPRCDALVVQTTGRLVGVLGADCPGVLIVDPVHRVLAVVHSGWRGTAANVVGATIDLLTTRFASRADELRAWIGPCIGAARYEVDAPVLAAIAAALGLGGDLTTHAIARPTRPGHAQLDLRAALAIQLTQAGLVPSAVATSTACTYADDADFFSHRRDGPRAGRHALVAGWRD